MPERVTCCKSRVFKHLERYTELPPPAAACLCPLRATRSLSLSAHYPLSAVCPLHRHRGRRRQSTRADAALAPRPYSQRARAAAAAAAGQPSTTPSSVPVPNRPPLLPSARSASPLSILAAARSLASGSLSHSLLRCCSGHARVHPLRPLRLLPRSPRLSDTTPASTTAIAAAARGARQHHAAHIVV